MSWWVHDLYRSGGVVPLASWIFWVLASITLHELGHGIAAIRQGDRTPIERGHMTLSPMVHMGPQSLILFALCGIAWGMMPVNPHRFRDGRFGDVLVSAAGPAVNVLLAILCVILLTIWIVVTPADAGPREPIAWFLYLGCMLNIFLAVFNCLPIPPLDGSRILAGFSDGAARLFSHPNAPLFGLAAFVMIFFMTPVGGLLWDVARVGTYGIVDAIGGLIGNPPLREVLAGLS